VLDNSLCGCGLPFRECPFWVRVGQDAFGGWERVDGRSVLALARSVDRHRYLPLLATRGDRRFDRRVDRYGGILSGLYGAIRSAGTAEMVVDSSNVPSAAYLLRRVAEVDLRVVHLIRDPRGVAYSWTRRVARPDTTGRTVYMDRYPPYRMAARWVTRNLAFEVLESLGIPMVEVHYEALIRAPRQEMRRILAWCGLPDREQDLGFITPGSVNLAVNHTVMGNPMRMRQGPMELRLDEEWKASMPQGQRAVVTVLAWPLLRRYGYRPNGTARTGGAA
jgi:hypothetical protein